MENTTPSFRNLTAKNYHVPKKQQHQLLQGLTRPHIESFNYLLHEGLSKIVENLVPQELALPNGDRVSINFQEVVLTAPRVAEKAVTPKTVKVYPAECRGRGVTYKGLLQAQIQYSVNGEQFPTIIRPLGQIPVMVKSHVCNLAKLSPKELIERGEEAEEMGGYFIVNGIEKVIRMLILPRRNYPTCVSRPSWKSRGPLYTEFGVSMRCVRNDQTSVNNVLHYLNNGTAMLNLNYMKEMFFVPIVIILKGLLTVTDKYIYDELVKGKEDDSFYKGCIVAMLRQALQEGLITKQLVLKYIGQRFRIKLQLPEWYTDEEVGKFLFKQCICIHLSSEEDKFNILVYMTKKLFDFAKGKCAAESADNPMFQEVLLGGHLYQMVIKERLEGYLALLKQLIERHAKAHKAGPERYKLTPEAMNYSLKYCPDLTRSMAYLLATGNLISTSGLGLMQARGLTVVADKLNFQRYISHFRCVHRGAFFAQMRTTSVRKLLPEAWGFLCPVHTPDGTPCGLMNHMTALCQVQTVTYQLPPLVKQLYALGVSPHSAPPGTVRDCYTVLMDGKLMGYVQDDMVEQVEEKLRVMKVKGLNKVPPTIEVCLVKKTEFASQYPGLYIFTTPARMMRPVLNLGLNQVEMIGTFEQVYMDISVRPEEAHEGVTTHQELSGVSILSFVANFTPFSDFNQSPRNMYQCQMGKQTMGVPCHALQHRSDNKLYKLQTPHSPIVRPVKYDEYDLDLYPSGTNAIVAVISYTGYDMEDAMVINKASYERGFAHASVYKSEVMNPGSIILSHRDASITSSGCKKTKQGWSLPKELKARQKFCMQYFSIAMDPLFKFPYHMARQSQFIDLSAISRERTNIPLLFGCSPSDKHVISGKLDLDGFPPVGTLLQEGCPYYSYINVQSGEQKVIYYKSQEPAYVEFVRAAGNDTGTAMLQKVCVMLRINRNPTIGDKFASRHGQKGVCSMMYPVADMPFSESGMTPDIIFNPHGYPSRMTIGMMIESMAGKAGAMHGQCYDATPFKFSEDDSAIDYFGKMLVAAGYNYYGTERLYSGVDGRELEASIFMGVVYYQRLRHMVSDKFQVRTTGPIDQLTHQPVKGRKRHGGVRFGEMERDALISHGTSFLLQDRLFNCSDKSMAQVCMKCGSLLSALMEKPPSSTAAASYESQRQWTCMLCKKSDNIQLIAVPYVFRYLVAELAAMNIKVDLDIS